MKSSANQKRILEIGTDRVLLDTRRMMLARAGFEVDTASSVADAKKLLSSAEVAYGLCVICHTVADGDRETIRGWNEHGARRHFDVPCLLHPERLIEEVRRALSSESLTAA